MINAGSPGTYSLTLAAGTYDLSIESDTLLAPANNVTIIGAGAGAGGTVLDGTGAAGWTAGLTIPTGAVKVSVEGVKLQYFKEGIAVHSGGGCVDLIAIAIDGCDVGLQLVESYQVKIDLAGSSLSGNKTGIKFAGGSSGNTIRNGAVVNSAGNGLIFYGGGGNTVLGCSIRGNNHEMSAYGGVAVFTGNNVINDNIIRDNYCYGVWADDALSTSPVQATGNWWGHASGPGEVGAGSGDKVSNYVIYLPWTGVLPGADTDADGMEDAFELQIIDADVNDGITTLADVQPGDDYDGGGWSNLSEYQFGSDPVNGNDEPSLTTLYVGGLGADDANVGFEGLPIQSLHEAIRRVNIMAPADFSIRMAAGTYDLSIESDTLLAPANNVTIIGAGAGAGGTVLDGTGAAGWTAGLTIPTGAVKVSVEGVKLQYFKEGIAVHSGGGCVDLIAIAIDGCDVGLQLVESYQVKIDLAGSSLSGNKTGIKFAGGSSGNTIRNGAVVNSAGNGLIFYGGGGNTVLGCSIRGNNHEMSAYGGVAVFTGNNVINDNVIRDNYCYGVWADDALSTAPVNASDNWWGDESGPGGVGSGLGDAVSAYIDFEPWTGYQQPESYEPPAPVDADGDGLPDWFEQHIINADADDAIATLDDVLPGQSCYLPDIRCDFDGDGITNWDELQAGTDPTNAVDLTITSPHKDPAYYGPAMETISISGYANNAVLICLINESSLGDDGQPYPAITTLVEPGGTWHFDTVALIAGQNRLVLSASASEDCAVAEAAKNISVVRDNTAPTITIESPTATNTYTTSLDSITCGGEAYDNADIASVVWSNTAEGVTEQGTCSGAEIWTSTPIPLVAGTDNQIVVTVTDIFGNQTSSQPLTVTHQAEVSSVEEDLASQVEEPTVDPLDLDEDGYLNVDELHPDCSTDPEYENSYPVNTTGATYPTDPNDPNFDAEKVKRDANNNIIGAYQWPDCLNPDDDMDGLPDSCELAFGSTTTDIGPDGDEDDDDLSNLQECLNGTDPNLAPATDFTLEVTDLSPSMREYAYDSNLSDYDQWMPGFGKVLRIVATWEGDQAPGSVNFSLHNTSKHPGRAVNDPAPDQLDPARYPTGYEYNAFDFGLTDSLPGADTWSYEQGPMSISDAGGGSYTIYVQCWDLGGRTRLEVTHPDDSNLKSEIWLPRGSGVNGIASYWIHDRGNIRLDPNADIDAVVFDNPGAFSAQLGDKLNNLEEYRGILYTPTIGGTLTHKRLNPHRKDLFLRADGFDDAIGDPYREFDPPRDPVTDEEQWDDYYPFRIGLALQKAGVDVHNTTGWGHDATEDYSFFIYLKEGTISGINGKEVTGAGTSWSINWPSLEWEFRLQNPSENWVPIASWTSPELLVLDSLYEGATAGLYQIRRPLPHINVLIVRLDKTTPSAYDNEDEHIRFRFASPPNAGNPKGTRHWAWKTKGLGRKAVKERSYGIADVFKIPLERYFEDTPFKKGTVWDDSLKIWRMPGPNDMMLAPLSNSEDPEDTLVFVDGLSDPNIGVLVGNTANGQWDGDQRLETYNQWESEGNLNPFDIDKNGFVELPTASDPLDNIDSNQHDDQGRPYTKARVVMHTILHEICHVLAGSFHSSITKDLMYKYSRDWKRDDYLSDWYRSMLEIHNEPR